MEVLQKEIWALNPEAKSIYRSEHQHAYPWRIKEFISLTDLLQELVLSRPQVILIFDTEQHSLFESYKGIVTKFKHFCPIIGVCDSSHTHEQRQQILAFGFNDCISQPIKENVVKSTLNHWINTSFDQNNQENNGYDPNEKVIQELLKFMDSAQLADLMQEFKGTTLNQLGKLKEMTSHKEQAEVLHDMKGSAASLGFLKIAESAEQVERLIKENQKDGIKEDLIKFVDTTHYFLINFTL